MIKGLNWSVWASQAALIASSTWKYSSVSLRICRRRAKWPPMIGCFGVHLVEGPTLIFDGRAKERRRQLIFHLFDAIAIGIAKKKSDHAIGKHPVDKVIDDRSQLAFAAQALEKETAMLGQQEFGFIAPSIAIIKDSRDLHHAELQAVPLRTFYWDPKADPRRYRFSRR